MEILKQCAKCGYTKDVTEFSKRAITKDGFNIYCKICTRIISSTYRTNNIDKIKKSKKTYYINNIDKIREHRKEYYANNKCKFRGYSKKYYLKNKDKYKGYSKKYYLKNKGKISAYCKFWLEQGSNREKHNAHNRSSYHRRKHDWNATRRLRYLISKLF